MDANDAASDNESIDWNTGDELEICNSPYTRLTSSGREPIREAQDANSSTGSSSSRMVYHFVNMGFSENCVIHAIEENGEDEASILDSLLTYSALETSPEEHQHVPEYVTNSAIDHLEDESSSRTDEINDMVVLLVDMGYSFEEALSALEKCGPNAHLEELTDFICAVQMEKEFDVGLGEPSFEDVFACSRPKTEEFSSKKKRKRQIEGYGNITNLPNPMIGFGIPDEPWHIIERNLPLVASSPPYFYYENVALTPKGVWSRISHFLYDIKPEFVDSMHFCAAARKRGYIHNLPIQNRYPLLPRPPTTVHEALPSTKKWWPSWDTRTKLNCLLTTYGSAQLTNRIRKALEDCGGKPTPTIKKYVLDQCKKWNLVWVGKNKAAPLEPDEMEMLLGFPKNHTRGGGISRSDRYKALGNSFQVDTVAYHLSVLKDQFPRGINVLSLFSGIGGAEVALHRLGIPLKNVVSVEISEVNRNILQSWWEQSNQKGRLIEIADVRDVDQNRIQQWINLFGGFDLVIGGSPCNNLAGGNRVSRDGLEGKQSSLFYEYHRILKLVRRMVGNC